MVALSNVENETISRAVGELVTKISGLNTDPYFREAIMRFTVRDLSWALLEEFEDQNQLSEQLGVMSELIHDHNESQEE